MERTKLRKQRFDEIAKKENTINLELFQKYSDHQISSMMYNTLGDTKKHNIWVDLIKGDLIDLKKDKQTNLIWKILRKTWL